MRALWTGIPKMGFFFSFFFFVILDSQICGEDKLSFDLCKGVMWKWIPQRQRETGHSAGNAHQSGDGKYNSSYQSEENNNPGLDLSSPVNDRGNYAHIVRQANRITVRFSPWLGCHPPNYYCASWLILSFSLSIILLSLSLPVLFHLFVCVSFFTLSFHSSCSPQLVLQANESKAAGNSLAPARPPACSGLIFCFTMSSHSGQLGEYSCPSLFLSSLPTLLLPLN